MKALKQLEQDNDLIRQEIVTYSSYYSEFADIPRMIPNLIGEIEERKFKVLTEPTNKKIDIS